MNNMKLITVSILLNGVRYTRFVNVPRDEKVSLTEAQLCSMFPALAKVGRGHTYSVS